MKLLAVAENLRQHEPEDAVRRLNLIELPRRFELMYHPRYQWNHFEIRREIDYSKTKILIVNPADCEYQRTSRRLDLELLSLEWNITFDDVRIIHQRYDSRIDNDAVK